MKNELDIVYPIGGLATLIAENFGFDLEHVNSIDVNDVNRVISTRNVIGTFRMANGTQLFLGKRGDSRVAYLRAEEVNLGYYLTDRRTHFTPEHLEVVRGDKQVLVSKSVPTQTDATNYVMLRDLGVMRIINDPKNPALIQNPERGFQDCLTPTFLKNPNNVEAQAEFVIRNYIF
jgi:hypothetical protein